MNTRRSHFGPRALAYVFAAVGVVSYGHVGAQLNCNAGIEFYPEGGIKSCNLNGHHRINTAHGEQVTCWSDHHISLYPNGRIQSCTVGAPYTIGDTQCEAGAVIDFDKDGKPLSCTRT